jgi:cytochrome c-type biogenesis protein CcmE
MPSAAKSPLKIVVASIIILATVGYLAFTGVRDNKSYYVTIGELQGLGDKAYVRHLRVAGNVAPGSIERAIGTYGRDGVFHATQLQAKCASKYAPAPGQTAPATTASVR